jgi:hypothetical protein
VRRACPWRWGLLAAVLLVTGLGCGGSAKTYKVKGVVTLDGQPVEGATVSLVPLEEGQGYPAGGLTGSDGSFRLTTFSTGDGAAAGHYKVLVTKTEAATGVGPQMDVKQMKKLMAGGGRTARNRKSQKGDIPAVYGNREQTPLRATVPADGPLTLDLRSTGSS